MAPIMLSVLFFAVGATAVALPYGSYYGTPRPCAWQTGCGTPTTMPYPYPAWPPNPPCTTTTPAPSPPCYRCPAPSPCTTVTPISVTNKCMAVTTPPACPYRGRRKRNSGQRLCFVDGHCPVGYSCCSDGCPGGRVCVLDQPSTQAAQVKVSLVFSSADAMSHSLLLYQVTPIHARLSRYINLEQIPFSKLQQSGECHYGASECLGNLLISCAEHHLTNATASLAFATCLTANGELLRSGSENYIMAAAERCLYHDPYSWLRVHGCRHSAQGTSLFHEAQSRQRDFGVPFSGTPLVAIDGRVVIQQVQDLHQFAQQVCLSLSHIPEALNVCQYLARPY